MRIILKKLLARLSTPLPHREGLGVGLLLSCTVSLFAQNTHYTPVSEGKYDAYMNFTGQVVENGVLVNGAEVAVFVAGECRYTQVSHNLSGTNLHGQPYSIDGIVTSYLAWGQSHKENITFKVWLPNGEERELAAVCPLVVESSTGMPSAPFILDIGKTAHTAVFNFRQAGATPWTWSTGSDGNQFSTVKTFEYDGLTVKVTDKKTTDGLVNYVNSEQGLRVAPGATVTLTAPEGCVITGIWPLNNSQRLVLDQTSAVLGYDGWTGQAESITLTNLGTSMNNLYGMEVRYASALLRGDANGDGSVSVTDIAVVVNSILQLPNPVFSFYGADANGDGSVTVTDIGVIVDIILGHNSNANARKWEDTTE